MCPFQRMVHKRAEVSDTSEKRWRRARGEDAWREDSGLACSLAFMHDREDVDCEIERARKFRSWQLNREFGADGTVVVRDGGMCRARLLGLSRRVLASRSRKRRGMLAPHRTRRC